jgi:PAS domain S-box-containing protein
LADPETMSRGPCRLAIAEIALALAVAGEAMAGPAAAGTGSGGAATTPVVATASPTQLAPPPGQIRFRVFGAADGLHNLVVWALAQDDAGMIWVGTDDGAYRYDGTRFAHFSVRDGLRSSAVEVLGVAPGGQVCAGGAQGMACWNRETQRFDDAGIAGLPKTAIRAIARRGTQLWVAARDGLYVRRGDAAFVAAPGWPGGNAAVPGLWADARGVVASFGTTIALGDGEGAWLVGHDALGPEPIDCVARDPMGVIWIRSAVKLWTWSPDEHRVRDVSEGVPSSHDNSGHGTALAVSPTGEVWVGTGNGVAYRRDDRWQLMSRDAGLPAAAVRSVLIDREGTTWLGAAGLMQWAGRSLVAHHNAPSGLPGDIAWNIGRDVRGDLWLGTDRCVVRSVAGKWQCQPGTDGRIVRTLASLPDGGAFLGGEPGELLYVDPSGGTRALRPEPYHPEEHILTLKLGPGGDLWMGTKGGIYRLAGARPGALERVAIPGITTPTRVSQLLYTDNRLWVTTGGGLAVLEGGRWRVLTARDGLRATSTRYLARRADGRMCVSYTEAIGLSCFRFDGQRLAGVEHIGETEGLAAGMVYFLGEDHEARLWVGTGNGVDVLTPGGLDHFGEEDGLVGNDGAGTAFFADADGSVWMGATGGVSHVEAQHYRGPPPPPHALIVDGRLGGQVIRLDAATPIQAPHNASSLLVEFAAGSFLDPDRLEFQSRLSPVEPGWTSNPAHEIRTPVLPPGSYHLEVRARLGAGAWGPTTALRFEVPAAWWQTRWILAAMLGAALGVLAVGFAWRYRAMVRRRTRQLIAQADASFRAHIDSIPDVVAVYRDGMLVHVNAAALAFFGARVDPRERVHDDDSAVLARLVTGAAAADPARHAEIFEVRLCADDGMWRVCEVSSLRLRYGGGPVMVVSGRDVTERQRMRAQLQAQLVEASRMAGRSDVATAVLHNVGNVLNSVNVSAAMVNDIISNSRTSGLSKIATMITEHRDDLGRFLRDDPRGQKLPEYFAQLPAVLERDKTAALTELRSLMRDIDDIKVIVSSQQSHVKRHAAVETFDVRDLVDDALELSAASSNPDTIEVVRQLDPLPPVRLDRHKALQILSQLLVNAREAVMTKPDGKRQISVHLRRGVPGKLEVAITDNGCGIGAEDLDRIFQLGFTTKPERPGLGLHDSACAASELQGSLTVSSAGVGGGATFLLVLPLDARAAA